MTDTHRLKATQRRNRINLAAIHLGIVLVGVVTAFYLLNVTYKAELSRQKAEFAQIADGIAHRAESRLGAYTTVTENLSSFLSVYEQDLQDHFHALAGVISQNNPTIMNIATSVGPIVTRVHPVEGNEAVLGLDYRTRPDMWASVQRAMASDGPVIFGPYSLVQGGQGLIIRNGAAFGSDQVYHVVLNLGAFLAEAGFATETGDFKATLRRLGNDGIVGETVLGDPALWDRDPVTAFVPLNDWMGLEIGVIPAKGWIAASPYAAETWTAMVVLALIGFFGVNYARVLIQDRATARRQLVTAIDSIEDGFVIYDQDDRLLFCNERYREYYRASADLLVPGNTFTHVLREGVKRGQFPEALGREEDWLAERLAHHANPSEPIEQRLADGRWLKIAESKTAEGYTVGFRVDVTELKTALMRAEEASAAKSDFLNTMSHEFRTPLSVILGYIAFLRNAHVLPSYKALEKAIGDNAQARARLDEFVAVVKDQAAKSDRSGQHLMGLINSVLDWSVLSAGTVDLSVGRVDVDQLLTQLCAELQDKAREKSLKLFYRGSVGTMDGDDLRLRQVFINLVANAIKFTDKGHVRIDADGDADSLRVIVEDTGPGIPETHRERIFDRFAQVDGSSKRKHGGAGLGLSICKSLVELHGGAITVSSREGKGSRFVVTLPRHAAGRASGLVMDRAA